MFIQPIHSCGLVTGIKIFVRKVIAKRLIRVWYIRTPIQSCELEVQMWVFSDMVSPIHSCELVVQMSSSRHSGKFDTGLHIMPQLHNRSPRANTALCEQIWYVGTPSSCCYL